MKTAQIRMEWPADVERQIVSGTFRNYEWVNVVRALMAQVRPCQAGSLFNPFFHPNSEIPVKPRSTTRKAPSFIPSLLHPLYESYPDDTEFKMNETHVILLSESSMRTDSTNSKGNEDDCFVSLAFRYAGMGHITLYVYVPKYDTIIPFLEGGANSFARNDNHRERMEMLQSYMETGMDPDTRVLPFLDWCKGALI